jgi:small GTP-binding protein
MLDPRPRVKVVFLGDSATGKTSIISRHMHDTFDTTRPPSTGASFVLSQIAWNGAEIALTTWDTAGQEVYRALGPMYYRDSQVGVVVFDVTTRATYDHVKGWIDDFRNLAPDAVVVICGNKIDLSQRRVTTTEAAPAAAALGASYVEASALSGDGVADLFQVIVKQLAKDKPDLLKRCRLDDAQPPVEGGRRCC